MMKSGLANYQVLRAIDPVNNVYGMVTIPDQFVDSLGLWRTSALSILAELEFYGGDVRCAQWDVFRPMLWGEDE